MEETIDETAGGQMRNLDPEVYDLDVMSGLFHEYKGPLGENKGIILFYFQEVFATERPTEIQNRGMVREATHGLEKDSY